MVIGCVVDTEPIEKYSFATPVYVTFLMPFVFYIVIKSKNIY